MKRLLLGVLVLAACSDDDGTSGPDAASGPDGGAGADAAPADAGTPQPDAPPAMIDAGDVLASCGTPDGTAQVVVPPGATMVVHCPDGQPSAIEPGGAQPITIDVVDGTMVTLIGDDIPITIYDIQPGQVVNPFGNSPPPGGMVANASVSLPGAFAGAVSYTIDTGCFSESTATPGAPSEVTVDELCTVDQKFVVYARALDANGVPLAYAFAKDIAVGGGNPTVTLATWHTDFVSVTLHLENAPAAFPGGVGLAAVQGGFGAGPARFQTLESDPDPVADGGSVDVVLPLIPAQLADRAIVKVMNGSFNQNDPNDTGLHVHFKKVSPVPAEMTFDLTAEALPLARQLAVDTQVAGRPGLTWTETGSLAAVDVKVGGLISQSGGWQFIGPADVLPPQRMPVMPPSVGVPLPAGQIRPIFFAAEIDNVAGYPGVLAGQITDLNIDGFDEPVGVNEYRVVFTGDM